MGIYAETLNAWLDPTKNSRPTGHPIPNKTDPATGKQVNIEIPQGRDHHGQTKGRALAITEPLGVATDKSTIGHTPSP